MVVWNFALVWARGPCVLHSPLSAGSIPGGLVAELRIQPVVAVAIGFPLKILLEVRLFAWLEASLSRVRQSPVPYQSRQVCPELCLAFSGDSVPTDTKDGVPNAGDNPIPLSFHPIPMVWLCSRPRV